MAHVSGMQSSCNGRNIPACSAIGLANTVFLKQTHDVISSGQDSQKHM